MRTLAVIIPWFNRQELTQTLRANMAVLRPYRPEVIIVNCGGNSDDLEGILRTLCVTCKVLTIPAEGFNKSLALNLAIAHCTCDDVLILDCDIVLDDAKIITEQRLAASGFAMLGSVCESQMPACQATESCPITAFTVQASMTFTWSDDSSDTIEISRECLISGDRAAPGILFAPCKDLQHIDGFNSQLTLWGWEDLDVQLRLQTVLGRTPQSIGRAIHLTHTDTSRSLHGLTRGEAERKNLAFLLARYEAGDLAGTMTADALAWSSFSELVKYRRGVRA